MASTDITSEKTKLHTAYKALDGKRVPSVTTIIDGQLGWNKRVLMAWQKRMAEAGEDPDKIRDKSADIGTLAHYMIECYLLEETPELGDYSSNDIAMAKNAYDAFLLWWKDAGLVFAASEMGLVSEKHRFGGTIDLLAKNKEGETVLIDFKTSNGVYAEHYIQVSAYVKMYEEMIKDPIVDTYVLQLSKDSDSFHYHRISKTLLSNGWKAFNLLLKLKPLQAKLRE